MTTIKLLSAAVFGLASAVTFADEPPAATTPSQPDVDASHMGISSCLQETGSHLPGANGGCLAGSHGKSYGRTQLLTGGATTSAASTLSYDPAIYIHGR